MQTVIDKLSDIFSAGFSAAGYDAALGRVVVSARPDLCQFQCNGAMSAAKQYRKAPLAIADDVAAALPANDVVATVSVVAPGFINITVKDEFIACYLEEMSQSENCGLPRLKIPAPSSLTTAGRTLPNRCMSGICARPLSANA